MHAIIHKCSYSQAIYLLLSTITESIQHYDRKKVYFVRTFVENSNEMLQDTLTKVKVVHLNPSSPHDALKHHFTSTKTDLISWNLVVWERKFSWKCFKNNSIFFHLSPTSSHFHPLQIENCGSNSRLVVDKYDNGKCRLERVNPYNAEIFLYTPWRPKVFSIWSIINVLFSSFRFIWIHMLWVYGYYKYFNSFSAGIVFRRQILMSKDGPRAERV